MTNYITVADVDELLGPDWTDGEKKPAAVLQANAFMTALNLSGVPAPSPDEVKQAGALLAKAAADGVLYQQQTESGSLTSKTVEADGVKVSKSYASGQNSSTSLLAVDVQLALDLLRPWRVNPLSFRVYR